MNSSPLDVPLNLMGKIGFHFTYNQYSKERFLRYLVLYNFIGTIFVISYAIHEAFQVGGDINELVVIISFCTVATEVLVSLASFYFWRNEFKFLIDYLIENLKEGEKMIFCGRIQLIKLEFQWVIWRLKDRWQKLRALSWGLWNMPVSCAFWNALATSCQLFSIWLKGKDLCRTKEGNLKGHC